MTCRVDDGGMKKLGNKMAMAMGRATARRSMPPQNIKYYCLLVPRPPPSTHSAKPLLQNGRACLESQALIYSCDPADALAETFQAELARACWIPIS